MKLIISVAALFLSSGVATAQNLRRDLAPTKIKDPSACTDPSAILLEIEYGLCDFPIILSGFFLDGLPLPAAEAHASHTPPLNNGVAPKVGYHRVSESDKTCGSVLKSYYSGQKGARITDPVAADAKFRWEGNFDVLRPPGQKSYVPEFPDLKGGLWSVTGGSIVFQGYDYTMLSYKGKKPFDICAFLADI